MEKIALYKTTRLFILGGIVTFLCGLFACTHRIDITTEDAPERLVIYGFITNDMTQHSIRITRSSGYFATHKPEGIRDAIVSIRTDKNTLYLIENPNEPGLYQTEGKLAGIEGETYTLYVAVDFDQDGDLEEFEASSYMPFAATVDSIGFRESSVFDHTIEVLLYGRIPELTDGDNYFSFHLSRNDTIVNDSLQGFFILSDEYLEKSEFNGLSCFYMDQEEEDGLLTPGDSVLLRVDVMTKEYATFLDNAREEWEGTNPIFGGPPANVETNIRSLHNPNNIPVSGFFSAYSGSMAGRIYYK